MRCLLAISSLLATCAMAASPPAVPPEQPICAHSSKTAKVALAMPFTEVAGLRDLEKPLHLEAAEQVSAEILEFLGPAEKND